MIATALQTVEKGNTCPKKLLLFVLLWIKVLFLLECDISLHGILYYPYRCQL